MTDITAPAGHDTSWDALRRQVRIISALVLREIRTRFGHSRLGFVWVLLEPVLHVAVLAVIYLAMMRQPLTGTSLVLFFLTGITPYFFFMKTATQVGGAISANRALLQIALVKYVDVIVARAVLELAHQVLVFIVLMLFLRAFDQFANTSVDVLTLAGAIALMWLMGVGIGTINAVLGTLLKSWGTIFTTATRPLYLLSGIFFLAERLPPNLAKWVAYNPVLHGVEFFRSAVYPGYGRTFIDMGYLAAWSVLPLVVGLASVRLMRRQLSAKTGTG